VLLCKHEKQKAGNPDELAIVRLCKHAIRYSCKHVFKLSCVHDSCNSCSRAFGQARENEKQIACKHEGTKGRNSILA